MNALRLVLNAALSLLCLAGGINLLSRESYFLRGRWQPDPGTYFTGLSLDLLGFGMLSLAAFAGAVALAWARGAVPFPDGSVGTPHPAYKGRLLLRYWYLVVPALVLIVAAFLLAGAPPAPMVSP